MNDHPPERVDPLLCVERELPLADLSSGFMRRKAMISYENTKTVRDLVWNTGREYAGRVFLRYEENDVVYEVTYDEFATVPRGSCLAAGAGRGSGPQGKSRINGKQQSPLPGIFIRRYGQRKCSGSLRCTVK